MRTAVLPCVRLRYALTSHSSRATAERARVRRARNRWRSRRPPRAARHCRAADPAATTEHARSRRASRRARPARHRRAPSRGMRGDQRGHRDDDQDRERARLLRAAALADHRARARAREMQRLQRHAFAIADAQTRQARAAIAPPAKTAYRALPAQRQHPHGANSVEASAAARSMRLQAHQARARESIPRIARTPQPHRQRCASAHEHRTRRHRCLRRAHARRRSTAPIAPISHSTRRRARGTRRPRAAPPSSRRREHAQRAADSIGHSRLLPRPRAGSSACRSRRSTHRRSRRP